MSDDVKIQSAAKLLSEKSYEEGSETIPKGSKPVSTQAEKADILTGNAEDEDIVHNRFYNFVKQAIEKHQEKFDYSKFKYVNAKTRGIIICSIHGEFEQSPDKHLNSKHACPYCWSKLRGKNRVYTYKKPPKSKDEFLEQTQRKYGNRYKYDLSSYTGITGNLIRIICPVHGEFEMIPKNHLINLLGCPKCGYENRTNAKTKSYQDFVARANQVFDNYYSYPLDQSYTNRKSIVEILCPVHGSFLKKAQKHLIGQGCFKCKVQQLIDSGTLIGGYNGKLFRTYPELKTTKAILYVLKIGDLFKIGITRKSVKDRIRSLSSQSKIPLSDICILFEKDLTLYESYKLEQKTLNKFRKNRIYKDWSTELLTVDVTSYVMKQI